jgi:hypothetical protein
MLESPATVPQVNVSVAGIDALCPTFNCGYKYVASVGEIES